jgi:hypothetical protein
MSDEVIVADVQESEHITTADLVKDSKPAMENHEPLFRTEESERFRNSWHDIQGGFVDEPRHAVEKADELVATVIKRLAEVFANERDTLEAAWAKGNDVSTEDLRQALRRYRSFFDRLLSV